MSEYQLEVEIEQFQGAVSMRSRTRLTPNILRWTVRGNGNGLGMSSLGRCRIHTDPQPTNLPFLQTLHQKLT
jgi:hypothetical protein